MIPWGGVGCCLGAAALYLLGREIGRDADALKSVTRVDRLKDLEILLDTARKVLPLVVTISGKVGAETLIKCEHSGLRGVIVEETAVQYFLKHNDAGSWIKDSTLMLSTRKEVPWYLDDGTGRVYVSCARDASGMVLTVASEVFEESGRSLACGTLDYLRDLKMCGVKRTEDCLHDLKMLGVVRTEKVLPTGTSLTVVGEAIKDDIGTIWIQKPHRVPFYVTPKNIDDIIAYLGNWARWLKYASMGLTAYGVYLLVKHAIQYITERNRRIVMQKRVLAAAATKRQGQNDGAGSIVNSDEGLDKLKRDQRMPEQCVICLEDDYNAVFVPCGHMCCCTSCTLNLTSCPICCRGIEQVVRTFQH